MKNFVDSSKVPLLRDSAQKWVGTPFHMNACVVGAGVDCVQLVSAIYRAAGFPVETDFPKYTVDGGQHLAQSAVEARLDKSGQFVRVNTSEVSSGDLLTFALTEKAVAHHVAIYLGGTERELIQALHRYGVVIRTLNDPTWRNALRSAYRPIIA